MSAFLNSVAEHIHSNYKDKVEKLCIVLPGKRGALFLKHHLARVFSKTIWLPEILSAEELIAQFSGLKVLEEIDLICHLYESYKVSYGPGAEPFDSFSKWGVLILQDFNEIDRYLAPPEQLYENLRDIKVIEHWSLGEEKLTENQEAYLRFMGSIGVIYKHFTSFLLKNGWAYQGLAYREAAKKFSSSAYPDRFEKMIFCGFNALNAAEIKIFNGLYLQKKAEMLWDADIYYLNDKSQEAGHFLRENLKLFAEREPLFAGDHFHGPRTIKIISVPKQIGQAQVVKQTIQNYLDRGVPLDKVAVVLANEKLLWPVLQQLPAGVEHVNITMEYPLRYTSTYSLIESLIQVQIAFSKQKRKYKNVYHRDLIAVLRQPVFLNFLHVKCPGVDTRQIISTISARNLSFITPANLKQLFGDDFEIIKPLLQPLDSMTVFCGLLVNVVQVAITYFTNLPLNNHVSLELEYLYIILKNFNRLTEILVKYSHLNDISAFRQLFTQVVGTASAPFIGEPLKGLQIMGVLETRTLDFEHLILVNVNEGILPSGKTISSFIPNDLKRAFDLPLYLEKDAIYAYHFYRLLHEANETTITYDSETDTFGKGEKSRFVTQLQLEMKRYNPHIRITEEVASYSELPEGIDNNIVIQKNSEILAPIIAKATSSEKYGALSPSGLTVYKECPLKFYFRYGVKLKETEDVEESAEANTFGSILHLSLENLYREFTKKVISVDALKNKLTDIEAVVNQSFISFFDNTAPVGKSILQQEVIKVYVRKLVNHDLRFIATLEESGKLLTLNGLEEELTSTLKIRSDNGEMTVFLKGKIDRLDSYNGLLRIVDYKSSVKDSDRFIFDGFENLFADKNYNKQLQLFIYAWLAIRNSLCETEKIIPCIIPFKVFNEEPKYILGQDKKRLVFTETLINDFESGLKQFIGRIFNSGIPFTQTDDDKTHEFCPYNAICNKV
jgi:ATP-dependent helicase/nuclease subunit B